MNIVVLPILFEGEVKAVMELASLERFNSTHQAFLDQLAESIGIVLNTIEATTRTENLLSNRSHSQQNSRKVRKSCRRPTWNWRKKRGRISRRTSFLRCSA